MTVPYPHFESLLGADVGLPFVPALWQHMPNPDVAPRRRKHSVENILKGHQMRCFQAAQVLEQLRADRLPIATTTARL